MNQKVLEAKATTTTDLGEFTALAAGYNVDRMNDRIIPGAFGGTIERWQGSGKMIPLHWDHSGDAKNIIGTVDPSSMQEVDDGLQVKGQLDLEENETAREAWRLMKKKAVSLSFGYLVTDEAEGKDGVRELKALDLFEVSVTPAPANPDTRFIDLKSTNENPAKSDLIWEKWAADHIVTDNTTTVTEVVEEVEEPEVKTCETCGHELTSEQAKAIEEAAAEEPDELVKATAQDPLSDGYDRLQFELTTAGIDMAEPPKVEKEPLPESPSLMELEREFYDLTLETLIGSEDS